MSDRISPFEGLLHSRRFHNPENLVISSIYAAQLILRRLLPRNLEKHVMEDGVSDIAQDALRSRLNDQRWEANFSNLNSLGNNGAASLPSLQS